MAKIIDTRGQICPLPLITTKAALRSATVGDDIEILTDNDVSCNNLISFLKEHSITPSIEQKSDFQILRFKNSFNSNDNKNISQSVNESELIENNSSDNSNQTDSNCEICTPSALGNTIIVLKSDMMGDGDPDFGKLLLRGYLNTLTEIDKYPNTIIAYNRGAFCAIKGSDTANTLEKLIERGVKVYVCGACVDFYNLTNNTVGEITNMYKISELLIEAKCVIYP